MLRVISSFEELKSIELELHSFYETYEANYFSSPAYCIKAYELFYNPTESNSIYFIIKKANDKIVGYIPFYIDTKGILKFIYDKHTDFLSEVGNQFDFNDYKKIAQKIENNTLIKKIDLDNLPSDAKLLHYFKHFFIKGCSVYSYNNHSFLSANAADSLLKNLSSSGRSELKRICKKNSQFAFKVFAQNEAFPKKQLEVLRLKMIANGSRSNKFLDENTLNLIEHLFQRGEVELFSKTLANEFVSSSIVLKNRKCKRMVWLDLYDDIQYINLSSYIEYIDYLDSNGMNYFNFGRGSYDYKAKNFQPNCENLYNLRYSKSKWDFFFTNYYPIKQFVKRIVKSKK